MRAERFHVVLVLLLALANVFAFVLLPLFLLPHSPWWLLALVPVALLTNTHWYVAHESFHGGLHPRRKINDALGRLLGVLFLVPFPVARFGHLMHHRFNRSEFDRPEVYDPAQMSWLRAASLYYFRLFGGLYLTEIATFFVFLQPTPRIHSTLAWLLDGTSEEARKMQAAALKTLGAENTILAIRQDAALAALYLMFSLILYGSFWYVVVAAILARAFLISFTDNLPHYGTPVDRPDFALNLRLPTAVSWLFLHFNHHRVHHQTPTLPWHELPKALNERGEAFDANYLGAGLKQLRGPIPMPDASG